MLQLILRTDALVEIFNQSSNKQDKYDSQKTALSCPNSLTKGMDGLFKYVRNRTWFVRA